MRKLQLPFVNLPQEFITLLKSNLPATTPSGPIFEIIRPNRALYMTMESAFKEFDDGRGLEKVMVALGWSNFRERMASIFIYKSIYGNYPKKSEMELVEEIKELETRFSEHAVHSYSRLFMLGFYLKLANVEIQRKENNQFIELKIPDSLGPLLKLSQGRTEKTDWLILILFHLFHGLGEKMLTNGLATGKKFNDLYKLLPQDEKESMHKNLLAYGASIREPDLFLYDKI